MINPMFAMVMLTLLIGVITVTTRFRSVKNGSVSARYFSLMAGDNIPEFVAKTTRSFNNQFEVPVLFYVVCSLYVALGIPSTSAIAFAWAFVVFRCIHTAIHLGYNNVLHRLSVFWLAVLCVIALWLELWLRHA